MKTKVLLTLFMIALPFCGWAQEDDMYFQPKKKEKVETRPASSPITVTQKVETVVRVQPRNDSQNTSLRDVDEYNRRSSYRKSNEYKNDTMYIDEEQPENDTEETLQEEGRWVNGFEGTDEDYTYAKRILLFRSPTIGIPASSPLYWDLCYGPNSIYWNVYDDGLYAYAFPNYWNDYYWGYPSYSWGFYGGSSWWNFHFGRPGYGYGYPFYGYCDPWYGGWPHHHHGWWPGGGGHRPGWPSGERPSVYRREGRVLSDRGGTSLSNTVRRTGRPVVGRPNGGTFVRQDGVRNPSRGGNSLSSPSTAPGRTTRIAGPTYNGGNRSNGTTYQRTAPSPRTSTETNSNRTNNNSTRYSESSPSRSENGSRYTPTPTTRSTYSPGGGGSPSRSTGGGGGGRRR